MCVVPCWREKYEREEENLKQEWETAQGEVGEDERRHQQEVRGWHGGINQCTSALKRILVVVCVFVYIH